MSNQSGGIFQVSGQKKGCQILTPYQRHLEASIRHLKQTNKVKSNNRNLIKVFYKFSNAVSISANSSLRKLAFTYELKPIFSSMKKIEPLY